jgi:quinoprotein glucose dehydrogenase
MPGEKAWPTQPIPTVVPHFVRHEVTKETLNPFYPNPFVQNSEKEFWHRRIDAAKSGLYIPPSDKYETIMMPGALAGANFGNSASNPTKGIVYIIAHEWASIYKLSRVKAPQELMSADDLSKAKELYASTCSSCHGEKMQGNGIAPDINNAGQRVTFDDFKTLLAAGKGQMPGFAHIEESRVAAIYRYLGGNPNQRFGNFGNRRPDPKMPDGPVVASGGAPIPADAKAAPAMTDYPAGVDHPQDRYTTDYGTNWPDLLGTPWSWVMAYDLNTGTVKWKRPIGEDMRTIEARNKGVKEPGAVSGGARKGVVSTSTGVVFCNGKGGKVYALDEDNGKILWETTLTRETNGQPIMYKLDGKEYLVVNATANFAKDTYPQTKKPGKEPRGFVVFALPQKK